MPAVAPEAPPASGTYIGIQAAARIARRSDTAIRWAIQTGRLPAIRVGGGRPSYAIREEDVRAVYPS